MVNDTLLQILGNYNSNLLQAQKYVVLLLVFSEWGEIGSLTHFDICFPQEVYYTAEMMSKPEKLLTCFLCPYWKFIQYKPIHSEGKGEVETE